MTIHSSRAAMPWGMAIAALAAGVCRADTYDVPGDAPTIQGAINLCSDGDEVVVADGLWTGPGNYNLNFGGRLITVRSDTGSSLACVIDCQDGGRGFIFVTGETAEAVVEGFTIRDGLVSDHGGGFLISGPSPTIRNCVITSCSAQQNGGGVYINGGSPTFTDCTFTGNSAQDDGGGVYHYGGSPAFTDCGFNGNTALSAGGGLYNVSDEPVSVTGTTFTENMAAQYGGAVFHGRGPAVAGVLSVEGCTFTGNSIPMTVVGHGGAIRVDEGELEIADGAFTSNSASGSGGAISNSVGVVTATDTQFTGNSAGTQGGAIAGSEGTATFTGCTFQTNSASTLGGGICDDAGDVTLTNCTFTANSTSADDPPEIVGGAAIAGSASTLTASGCTLSTNMSADYGGGILVMDAGTLQLADSTLQGNQATTYGGGVSTVDLSGSVISSCRFENNDAGWGGAAFFDLGPHLVTRCVLLDNSAAGTGGAFQVVSQTLTVINCIFAGNTAEFIGGGISLFGADASITNCSFSGNGGGNSGGAIVTQADLTAEITNCTIWGNTALNGGGVGTFHNGSLRVTNCIVWGNGDMQINPNAVSSVTWSDVEGGWPATGNIDADPLFVDPYGPDSAPGTEDDDFRLLAASPCIDSADNTAVPSDAADLDGDGVHSEPCPLDLGDLPRFVDHPYQDDTGKGDPPIVDMGAHEWQLPETCPWDCGGDWDGNVGVIDFLMLLAQWGTPGYCDFDGSGVSVTDFLLMLAHWGPCP